jgi:hypothetical protein
MKTIISVSLEIEEALKLEKKSKELNISKSKYITELIKRDD